jgi:hypothetical protein
VARRSSWRAGIHLDVTVTVVSRRGALDLPERTDHPSPQGANINVMVRVSAWMSR